MDVNLLSPIYLEHVSRTTINLDSSTVLLSRNDSTLYNFPVLRKRLAPGVLPLSQLDVAISFYDLAADYPHESFEQITKRLLPHGFGRSKTAAAFEREARRMFSLAR
ncbi:MAG TPA: hypothetical protein VNO32_52240 [Candidatus Acidoferrum sp.]|nr:hypothetical protein [Candidatus Acidoferrum sp.]